MAKENVIDILPIGAKTDLKDVLRFGGNVLEGTVKGVLSGVASTASDALKGTAHLCRGEVKEAADIAVNRVTNIGIGAIKTVESGLAITEATVRAVVKDEPFLTEQNEKHMTRLCQMGVYVATGSAFVNEDNIPEGTHCAVHGDACALPGVENGVFTGDADDLQQLIEAGEVEGATYVSADDVERSAATRAEFLAAHGIEDAQGWEVHHVQPVSAGGEDAVENMVLISPEDHDAVTSAHREFYGWNRQS